MALQAIVVGAGQRGRQWVREMQKHQAWTLAAVVDRDEGALESLRAEHPKLSPSLFKDLTEAYERVGPDCAALVVATPPDLHVEPARWAIERSIAVLIEKPFTVELRDAIDLVNEAEAAGVPLLVAQNQRYLRRTRTVRKVLQQGVCGRIGFVTAHYYRAPHVMSPSLGRLQNSVLWGIAVHHLDALRYVLDDHPTGICATTLTQPWTDLPPGGTLQALLSFEGGTQVNYSATYESSGHEYFEGGQEFYQRFVGERGTLHVFHRWLVLCLRGKLPRIVRRGRRPITEEQILLEQLASVVTGRGEAECTGRDNLKTIALCEAALKSAEESRWVDPRELLDALK